MAAIEKAEAEKVQVVKGAEADAGEHPPRQHFHQSQSHPPNHVSCFNHKDCFTPAAGASKSCSGFGV